MDQIFIRNLRARGIVGVYEWERHEPQDIVINITLFVDLLKAGQSDDLNDTINYHTLATKVQAHAESAERFTIEALATDIAQLCLHEAEIVKVQVRVEKPKAIRFTHSVGVEIERSQDDFIHQDST